MKTLNINYKSIIKVLIIVLLSSFLIYVLNEYQLIFSNSFLAGGLISIISNFVFANIFFRKSNNESAQKIIFRLSLGFLLKMIIVIFLFSCIFLINKLLSFWVILGFIFTTVLFLIANFFKFSKKKINPTCEVSYEFW